MIDLHCHILPCIDDGPANLQGTLEMATMAARDGTKYIVATPHMCEDNTMWPRAVSMVNYVNVYLEKQGLELRLLPGGENCIFTKIDIIKQQSINNTDYVLLEFPHTGIPAHADRFIFNLRMAGCTPVIAHPERNISIMRNPSLLARFVEMGALAQVTAGSLTGDFGQEVMNCAKLLLQRNVVHVLASDGHSPTRRPPLLSGGLEAAAALIGRAAAERMVYEIPEKIIYNIPIQ
jgi:protein-tyrosine phosphatase